MIKVYMTGSVRSCGKKKC